MSRAVRRIPAELVRWVEGLDESPRRLVRFMRAQLAAGRSPAVTLGLALELNTRLVAPVPPQLVADLYGVAEGPRR